MRANDDVNLTSCEVVEHLSGLFSRTSARQIVDPYGQILKSFAESFEMLEGQNRCGHHHGYLFGVACSFKSGAYSHLCLAETYVATHQTIHRAGAFHVGLHLGCGFQLVGGVVVKEASFQFVLHERIVTEGKSTFGAPFGIELNQVARNVFDALLGFFFQSFPCSRA